MSTHEQSGATPMHTPEPAADETPTPHPTAPQPEESAHQSRWTKTPEAPRRRHANSGGRQEP